MTYARSEYSLFHSKKIVIFLICIVLVSIGGWYFLQKYQDTKLTTNPGHAMTSASSPSGRYWIMDLAALNDIVIDPSAKNTVTNDTIFVPDYSTEKLVPQTAGLHLVPTETFTSEASLVSAISEHKIKTDTKALLYDNEPWSLTPEDEQANPLAYYQKASSIAHSAGYIFIATPVSKVDTKVDTRVAPYADILDIQSQYDQPIAEVYANHVLPIAKATRIANKKLIVLAGLSTNPSAGIPTTQQLTDDARAVSSDVQGYWLNIPSPGSACPKCNLPQPQIGIQLLSNLGAK